MQQEDGDATLNLASLDQKRSKGALHDLVYEGAEDIYTSNLSTLASLKDTAVTNNESMVLAGATTSSTTATTTKDD